MKGNDCIRRKELEAKGRVRKEKLQEEKVRKEKNRLCLAGEGKGREGRKRREGGP